MNTVFIEGVSLFAKRVLFFTSLFSTLFIYSCTPNDILSIEYADGDMDTVSVTVASHPYWETKIEVFVNQYASLGYSHQSAAAFGRYAFFVKDGHPQICLYNLVKKEKLCVYNMKMANKNTYHCNQSTFGIELFEPSDPFPLLYISQRALSDQRCFIEVYRIKTVYDDVTSEYKSFSVEKVQTVFLPAMKYENSLGNANCVIDPEDGFMYTYSRNNNTAEDNYKKCKISKFAIPDIHNEVVYLEDKDILSSFMIDCSALNMQGGCINDGILYIGQGFPAVGYVYLNVVDLANRVLLARIDLQKYQVNWEPEGCFFFDNSVMLAHTDAINRISIR